MFLTIVLRFIDYWLHCNKHHETKTLDERQAVSRVVNACITSGG